MKDSWGMLPPSAPAAVRPMAWSDQAGELAAAPGLPRLAYGQGRSYGDVCLNNGGTLISTRALNRVLAYDPLEGRLTAEAGITFGEIIDLVVPDGWFTPVTPGTSKLTLGGAVANDVHGKEHRTQGTFGRHVVEFTLWRSDRGKLVCSPAQEVDLFRATIGGLGLTGLISQVTIRLLKIAGPSVLTTSARGDLADLLNVQETYSVAWVDAARNGPAIVTTGEFGPGPREPRRNAVSVPAIFPSGLLNRTLLDLLNSARWSMSAKRAGRRVSIEQFFHPLDRLSGWNHFYGPRGFYQHQCVIPLAAGMEPIRDLLRTLRRGGGSSFVSVLKSFGPLESPGLLSFPLEGVTLALDLPNAGQETLIQLAELDEIVVAAGGRLYPAKDARMSSATFRNGYPQWETFARFIDPAFSSTFWRRVTA